ncbi:unnamed protein product [Merluccius merluccius]
MALLIGRTNISASQKWNGPRAILGPESGLSKCHLITSGLRLFSFHCERPYSCKDCTKQFTQLNALQRHQRIHTGEKPYMCGLCNRTFTDKSTVRRHTMTHDTDAPWKNYLVVLQGNVEGKKPRHSAKGENSGTGENQNQNKAGGAEAAGPEGAKAQTQTQPQAQAEALMVPGQPVTLPADWATHGTIALVSHDSLGGITVIHTEMPPGATGTNVISLDGSTIAVPFALPVSMAQALAPMSAGGTITTTTTDTSHSAPAMAATEVSESHAATSATACVLEAAVSQTILAPALEGASEAAAAAAGPPADSGVQGMVSCGEQLAMQHAPSDQLQNTDKDNSIVQVVV